MEANQELMFHLSTCLPPLLPSCRDNPALPSPLVHAQRMKKDKCLQYQQTLI